MTTFQKTALVLLRIALGCLFLYAGLAKVVDSTWTAAGYLRNAESLTGFYLWLATPGILPFVDFLNEWGLTLIGLALVFGAFVRTASVAGVVLMALYWLPLGFLHPNEHALIVDEHIIYAAALLVLASFHAGRVFGLEAKFRGLRH